MSSVDERLSHIHWEWLQAKCWIVNLNLWGGIKSKNKGNCIHKAFKQLLKLRVDTVESAESFLAWNKAVNVYECLQACVVPRDFVILRKHRVKEQCVCIKFWFKMGKNTTEL